MIKLKIQQSKENRGFHIYLCQGVGGRNQGRDYENRAMWCWPTAKTPAGEIDLILHPAGGPVVFVEVKQRASLDAAAYAIQPAQQQRLLAADTWLSRYRFGGRRMRLTLFWSPTQAKPSA